MILQFLYGDVYIYRMLIMRSFNRALDTFPSIRDTTFGITRHDGNIIGKSQCKVCCWLKPPKTGMSTYSRAFTAGSPKTVDKDCLKTVFFSCFVSLEHLAQPSLIILTFDRGRSEVI